MKGQPPAYKTVMMKPYDTVAVALEHLQAGTRLQVQCQGQYFDIELLDSIEFGHKFAVRDVACGQDILKYGEVIGSANRDIRKGEHVHVHNLDGKRGRGDQVAGQ